MLGVGAAFLGPIGQVRARRSGAATEALDDLVAATMAPALFSAGVFGGALVGLSDDAFDFAQTWLAIAGPLWLAVVALAVLIAPPGYVPAPEVSSERKAMLGGLLHLGLAAMLVVMIWQPGF